MEETNKTSHLKLYSSNAIWASTFLGGPLAAGYMIKENYAALNQSKKGKNALIISILFTLLLFSFLLFVPESIIDKIPRILIPTIYSLIVYFIVEQTFGTVLKEHKQFNNAFQPAGKSILIGIISCILSFAVIVGFTLLVSSPEDEVYEKYNIEIEKFSQNEAETLVFYDYLETRSASFLLYKLDEFIPKWEENKQLLKKISLIDNLSPDIIEQNTLLLRYTELRITAFQLFKKAIAEETRQYDLELDQVHREIETILKQL